MPINRYGEFAVPFEILLLNGQIPQQTLYEFQGPKEGRSICNDNWLYVDKDYIHIVLENTKIKTDVNPMIVNGRTLVPLRTVVESMGCDIGWYEESQMVVVQKNGISIPFILHLKEK